MEVVKGLYYSEDHEWVKVEGNKAYIGISDFAQSSLGDIVFVELPDTGAEFSKNDSFGAVESVKAASDLNMPVSGKIVEVNDELTDDPSLLNEAPYEKWLIAVEMSDKSELDGLMNSEQYEEFCAKEA